MINLPIGYSDFREVVDGKLDFVDKSLLIPEIIKGPKISLITRPRRFGKTFNMSMLRYFFAETVDRQPTKGLFDTLQIAQMGNDILEHQGKYPVIFLTFKDIKESTFDLCFEGIYETLLRAYNEFSYLLTSEALSDYQKNFLVKFFNKEATPAEVQGSLLFLTECLFRHHGVRPVILIDEYDTPIQSGFLNGYYDQAIHFFRSFLGSALKDNNYLTRAVLTGILRVSRESLFSGLNNIVVYSLLDSKLSEFFGFTQTEIDELLLKSNLQDKASEVKNWYNGYQIGETFLYNPWSIINCINNGGSLEPFWVNTSDNALIKDLLIKSSTHFKTQFETLLQDTFIEQRVDQSFVFPDLEKNHEMAVWTLMVMTGYLTVQERETGEILPLCRLAIPNHEVRSLFQLIIKKWLANGYGLMWYEQFIDSLLKGEVAEFEKGLQQLMDHTVSVHDVAREPEAFYQGLMIGLTASLANHKDYELKSNRESGQGRYDYLILARDPEKLSILLEFKKVSSATEGALQKAAQGALEQIEDREYVAELQQRGLSKVLKIGIAFSGKRFALAYA